MSESYEITRKELQQANHALQAIREAVELMQGSHEAELFCFGCDGFMDWYINQNDFVCAGCHSILLSFRTRVVIPSGKNTPEQRIAAAMADCEVKHE